MQNKTQNMNADVVSGDQAANSPSLNQPQEFELAAVAIPSALQEIFYPYGLSASELPDSPVLCSIQGRALHITINRPERMNAIDSQTNGFLAAVMDFFATEEALWLAVIRGTGERAFSAGGDIRAMNEAAAGGEAYRVPETGYAGLTSRFNLNKPVIAAVNGLAMGGGFEIALAADLVIAAEHASFGLPEPHIGVVAYAGGMHRLPRQLGMKRAMQLLLACDTLSAPQALEWGLINQVVPAAELDNAVQQWIGKLLRAAPLALQATKACVQQGLNHPLPEAILAQEQGGYTELEVMRNSHDILEGITAFAQKRSPCWQGR
ncbi:enoyl-CoA hydratase [Shewanella sp. NFH-SH190041]|uniref:enoyl-CoA hydratase-related protein n=1 Tax=Shewanella sp. NFH-SH190041 TaxID=2950245 RepID=UPI0021C35AC6|nr:enoyl-CoA hydratase-related protein [Shewanella sp. NFH-SH190041]BDM64370.1 enoyl-CoA hydratase [Shewanella sp. NFH-SH190041]